MKYRFSSILSQPTVFWESDNVLADPRTNFVTYGLQSSQSSECSVTVGPLSSPYLPDRTQVVLYNMVVI